MDLRNQFLLAMPTLADPNFQRTLTYVCDHSEHGAMGLVVNRPMAITIGEVLNHLEIAPSPDLALQTPVHYGGPVESERGFLLHSPPSEWDGSIHLTAELALTTSRDLLEAVARNAGPPRLLMMLGYSGWAPGQLEQEVADNAWLSAPAASDILFETPAEERLGAAAARIGVDLSRLSADSGHA